jgi:iron(II)-dependent oxidoreductase
MWDLVWEWVRSSPGKDDQPSLSQIGSYPSGISPYGVFDLVGNASEWTADYYNWAGYDEVSRDNPLVLEPAWNHVLRGSAWLMPYGESLDGYELNRCSTRSSSHGDTRDARMGFRCASSSLE